MYKRKSMEDFLSRFQGNKDDIPPEVISVNLEERFFNPKNIEWTLWDDHWEAIFYSESTEHLACYTREGRLINYKINVAPSDLSGNLSRNLDPGQEIMNVVKVISGEGVVSFEIITRDIGLKRYLVNMDRAGRIASRHNL